MWKFIIKFCQLCFQIVARVRSLLSRTSSATAPVQVTSVSRSVYCSDFLAIFLSTLAPSLLFTEYSEWSFENVCHLSVQNPLLVFLFTWDKSELFTKAFKSPCLSPWPILLLLSPLTSWFHPYWSSSCSLNAMYRLLPQDLCTCYFPFLECSSFRYWHGPFILLRLTRQFNMEDYLFWLFNLK